MSVYVYPFTLLRRNTRTRRGGERGEALSLSIRLFLTAAISLIRLWRNRNLALHRPILPLPLPPCILFTHSFPCLLPPPPHPTSTSTLFFSSSSLLSCPSVRLASVSHLLLLDESLRYKRNKTGRWGGGKKVRQGGKHLLCKRSVKCVSRGKWGWLQRCSSRIKALFSASDVSERPLLLQLQLQVEVVNDGRLLAALPLSYLSLLLTGDFHPCPSALLSSLSLPLPLIVLPQEGDRFHLHYLGPLSSEFEDAPRSVYRMYVCEKKK